MKKMLALIMALVVMTSLCGCDTESKGDNAKEDKKQNSYAEIEPLYNSEFASICLYGDSYVHKDILYITATGDVFYEDEKVGSNAVMVEEDYILYSNGTISNQWGNMIEGLNGIVAIEQGNVNNGADLITVKKDGTVDLNWSEGSDFYKAEQWTDIVGISAADFHMVGLKSDGTVVATGSNGDGECNVEEWTDIVAIYTARHNVYHSVDFTYGIKKDGTVVCTDGDDAFDLSDWTDIVALAPAENFIMGLKSDGTVVTAGEDINGETKIDDWKDIVAIKAYRGLSIGVKADGSVVSAGDDYVVSKYLKDVKIKVN